MSEILSRTVFETCLADQSEAPWEEEVRMLLAHDAALRAEVERLKERLDRIDAFAGERCEASGCRPDPCGPVEYHDTEGVPLCAECWQECLDEAAECEERGKEKGNG